MNERRNLPRWQINKAARVQLDQKEEVDDCLIEDMNLKGMKIILEKRLSQDNWVRMGFELPENFSFRVDVQIPWVREVKGRYVHGVCFKMIQDEDKERIYQYVSKHCSQQLKDQWWQNGK